MRKQEFVVEYERDTDNGKKIFAELKKAGYQYLGGGIDATVWGRDEGEVLKVLMPRYAKAEAERGFLIFHDACIAMKSSPHVPRFLEEYSVFEINGEDYMQITMERLYPIPNGSVDEAMVWGLSELATVAFIKWSDVDGQLGDPDFWTHYVRNNHSVSLDDIGRTLGDSYAMSEYKSLFATMVAFHKILMKHNDLNWDLHTENVMQRDDGTLVITDPFMV
jgi:hypothetical protein